MRQLFTMRVGALLLSACMPLVAGLSACGGKNGEDVARQSANTRCTNCTADTPAAAGTQERVRVSPAQGGYDAAPAAADGVSTPGVTGSAALTQAEISAAAASFDRLGDELLRQ